MTHPLAFNESPEERQSRRQGAYADRMVNFMLSRYKLTRFRTTMQAAARSSTGNYRLTLDQFAKTFNFPVYLFADVIPWVTRDMTLDKLFNHFTKRKILTRYEELSSEFTPEEYDGMPSGLIFKWPKISRGLILHNRVTDISEPPSGLTRPCVRMIWSPTTRTRRNIAGTRYLTLEPLEQFLAGVNWEPEAE